MDRSRFVVLEHTQPASQIPLSRRQYLNSKTLDSDSVDIHYDLMLECESGLVTFAIPEKLSSDHTALPAMKLPLHREAYLDYEGTVSDDRGTVRRAMVGTFETIEIVPQVSLEDSFKKLVIEIIADDQKKMLRLVLEQVEHEKFELSCSD
jgi:hypothetical protein